MKIIFQIIILAILVLLTTSSPRLILFSEINSRDQQQILNSINQKLNIAPNTSQIQIPLVIQTKGFLQKTQYETIINLNQKFYHAYFHLRNHQLQQSQIENISFNSNSKNQYRTRFFLPTFAIADMTTSPMIPNIRDPPAISRQAPAQQYVANIPNDKNQQTIQPVYVDYGLTPQSYSLVRQPGEFTTLANDPSFQNFVRQQQIKQQDEMMRKRTNEIGQQAANYYSKKNIDFNEHKGFEQIDQVIKSKFIPFDQNNQLFPFIKTYPNLQFYNDIQSKSNKEYLKYIRVETNSEQEKEIVDQIQTENEGLKYKTTLYNDCYQTDRNKFQQIIFQQYNNADGGVQTYQVELKGNDKKQLKVQNYRAITADEQLALDKYANQFKFQDIKSQLQLFLTKINQQIINQVDTNEYLFFEDLYHLDCQEQNCQMIMKYVNIRSGDGITILKKYDDLIKPDKDIHEHYFLINYQKNKYDPVVKSIQEIQSNDSRLKNFYDEFKEKSK